MPKIFFAICCNAILIPKVANNVSKGFLYKCLITNLSIATPAKKVIIKAKGKAINNEIVWFGINSWIT